MNFVALTVLVVCAPPYQNYYSHPGCCKIKPGVVCAGGTCLTCSQSPLPGYGSAPYNYRIMFDYPWHQTHWLPPTIAPAHYLPEAPQQPEEIMGYPDMSQMFEGKLDRQAPRPLAPAQASTRVSLRTSRATDPVKPSSRRKLN